MEVDPKFQITTLKDFKQWVLHNFSEHLSKVKHWESYENMTQDKQEFQVYTMRFQEAATHIGAQFNNEILIHQLLNRTNRELQAVWYHKHNRPTGFIDVVIQMAELKQSIKLSNHFSCKGHLLYSNTHTYGDPMDLSALKGVDQPKKNTPKWKAWCHANTACFGCGKTGT